MTCTRILAIVSLLFLSMPALYPAWQTEDLLSAYENSPPDPNQDAAFCALKASIKEQLKESWCSDEKTDILMDTVYIIRPEVCVEIGAFTGSTVLPVAAALRYLNNGKIYAIDAWSNEEAIRNLECDDPNWSWWAAVDMKAIRQSFDLLIESWDLSGICTPIAATSAAACDSLPEIDFLHLDGNFSEESSLQDIMQYLPKVKQGGYIMLSNVYHSAKNKQPKLKSFIYLFEACEFISDADNDNAVLFRKL